MLNLKEFARRQIARRGWFLRKIAGLPAGVCLEHDLIATTGLPPPRNILDVGAHHGETAERFTRAFPTAKINSLEPVSANFCVLADRACLWPNVACHKLALSDRIGDAKIVLQPDSQMHSLQADSDAAALIGREVECIKLTTLDDFTATEGIHVIDLLKLDTEGHEITIFKGAHGLLTHRRISSIFMEASLDPADTDHTPLLSAAAFLRAFGFELAGIYDQVMWKKPTKLAYFNALFVCVEPNAPFPSSKHER